MLLSLAMVGGSDVCKRVQCQISGWEVGCSATIVICEDKSGGTCVIGDFYLTFITREHCLKIVWRESIMNGLLIIEDNSQCVWRQYDSECTTNKFA